jgi:hypothetical protein
MSATLFNAVINGGGHSGPFTDLVSAERYGKGGTLALRAWCGRSHDEPKQPARLYLESSVDGSDWTVLVDFGEVREDVVSAEPSWDGTSELRVRYAFDPGGETSFWWPVVRLN